MAAEESTPAVPAASGAPVETGAGSAAPTTERSVSFTDCGLAEQDLETLDVTKLHPLSPEVISRQATINIGTIGHVAHGKSTIVKSISGVKTVRFKNELVRNITIKLGYANAKIYKSKAAPWRYEAHGSGHPDEYVTPDGVEMRLVRHVSFVDCPGHDILMATMLNGAAVMDAALLLIAANEPCPQPQTAEHLAATEIMQLSNLIIVQNKIDLVKPDEAAEQHGVIQSFVEGTPAARAPIIPASAQLMYNVDLVCRAIAKKIPMPIRDFTSSPRLIVIRSFDVNKPGEQAENLKGGVAGGSILRGVLREGDEIEVRPGIITKSGDCVPVHSRIMSLFAEKNTLKYAVPGGLIGVGTKIDPILTRSDRLVGQVLGLRGHLPPVFNQLDIQFHLLRRLLGQKSEGRQKKVTKVTKKETLMLNVGSTSTAATVTSVKGDRATLSLVKPVCTELGAKVALSRKVDKHWRLIGHGNITAGTPIALKHDLNPSRAKSA